MFARRSGRCVLALAVCSISTTAPAAITTDGTLGPARSFNGTTVLLPASLGRQKGGNVFQSFRQFDIAPGTKATFTATGATAPVKNVLARVTGGQASQINGQLGSNIAGANLYLINPAGITFGPGSSLNVSGTFSATTADVIKLVDGHAFSVGKTADGVLTGGTPTAFGFLSKRPGAITIHDTTLTAPAARLVGGSLTMTAATLACPGGHVGVVVSKATDISISPKTGDLVPAVAADGAATLTSSCMTTDGTGGGRIDLHAGALTLTESDLAARTTGERASRGIDVDVRDKLLAIDSGVDANTTGAGDAGPITLHAGTARFEQTDATRDFVGVRSRCFAATADGDSGSVAVSADVLQLLGGAYLSGTTDGHGHGGAVTVTAGRLRLSGGGNTGIYAETHATATGDGGTVIVRAGVLDEIDGASIDADTSGVGRGGIVDVGANTLRIDAAGQSRATAITSSTLAAGDAGSVRVTAKTVSIRDYGYIASSTSSTGPAGKIDLRAGTLLVDASSGSASATGVLSQSGPSASGPAGDVTVTAGAMSLVNGGVVTSSTFGSGNAGAVAVTADRLTIDAAGDGAHLTGIASEADAGATGSAGNVDVRAGALVVRNDGGILSTTNGPGRGGDVRIRAGTLSLTEDGSINSDSYGSGNAGLVRINAGRLTMLTGGEILSESFADGRAGDIVVVADRAVIKAPNPDTDTQISSDSTGDDTGPAGNVTVRVGRLDLLDYAFISSDANGDADAGTVSVTSHFLTMRHIGTITSDTYEAGRAGTVRVDAGTLSMDSSSSIESASYDVGDNGSGDAGDVSVKADRLDVHGGASIDSSTYGPGKGGAVNVRTQTLTLRSAGSISSDTSDVGPAGRVSVQADRLFAAGTGTTISSQALDRSRGRAGDVAVNAGRVELADHATISSGSVGDGDAGLVAIDCRDLRLGTGAEVTAASTRTRAGGVTVNASDSIVLRRGTISSSSAGDGGNIALHAGRSVRLDQGTVTAQAGENGLRLSIDPLFVILNRHSTINGLAGDASKGFTQVKVFVDPSAILIRSPDSTILSDNPVLPPDVDLTGAILHFVVPTFGQQTALAEGCEEQSRKRNLSSFVAKERLGTPPAPGAAVMSPPMSSASGRDAPAR